MIIFHTLWWLYILCLGGSTHAGGYYNDTQLVSKAANPTFFLVKTIIALSGEKSQINCWGGEAVIKDEIFAFFAFSLESPQTPTHNNINASFKLGWWVTISRELPQKRLLNKQESLTKSQTNFSLQDRPNWRIRKSWENNITRKKERVCNFGVQCVKGKVANRVYKGRLRQF